MHFNAEGGATNLRSLTAIHHDAIPTFARTVACNSKMLETLRSVTISRDVSHVDDPKDTGFMQSFFQKSKALENVQVSFQNAFSYANPVSAQYIHLYDELLSSFHFLSFQVPRDCWIKRAKDTSWLPNFAFSLERAKKPVVEEENPPASDDIMELY
ncbi:hypothetical protein H1R20_g15108, partial [Candolleomyces eurysporus]